MINVENNRFPHSADLFKFCKEVLVNKKSASEKVTDQDVGSLLGFDPADCTHWKYGRKNIKSIQNINQLARSLELDPRNLIDISLGKTLLFDALVEFNGYGEFICSPEERYVLLEEANRVISLSNTRALPVLIPELSSVIPNVEIRLQENQTEFVQTRFENGMCIISWQKSEKFGTALRFLLAKEFATVLLKADHLKNRFSDENKESYVNYLALFLLMPQHLLQIACSQCDPARDTVEQLMGLFWMSRTLVNVRLKDFLLYRN